MVWTAKKSTDQIRFARNSCSEKNKENLSPLAGQYRWNLKPQFRSADQVDLSVHSFDDLAAVAMNLNARPRKALQWKKAAEALDRFLR